MTAEQREQLELAPALCICLPQLAHRVEDQDRPGCACGRCRSAGSRGGRARSAAPGRPSCAACPGVKYAPENESCISVGTFTSTPPTPSTSAGEAGEVDVDDVRHVARRRARRRRRPACAGPSVLPALILSPFQQVSRGMSSIVAWCFAGIHAEQVQRVAACAADTRARVVADEQDEERRRRRAVDAVGRRRGCELLDAQVRRARRDRHAHAARATPRTCPPHASTNAVTTAPTTDQRSRRSRRFTVSLPLDRGRRRRRRPSAACGVMCTRYAVTIHFLPAARTSARRRGRSSIGPGGVVRSAVHVEGRREVHELAGVVGERRDVTGVASLGELCALPTADVGEHVRRSAPIAVGRTPVSNNVGVGRRRACPVCSGAVIAASTYVCAPASIAFCSALRRSSRRARTTRRRPARPSARAGVSSAPVGAVDFAVGLLAAAAATGRRATQRRPRPTRS